MSKRKTTETKKNIDYAARKAARTAVAMAKKRANTTRLSRSGGYFGPKGGGIEKKSVDTSASCQFQLNPATGAISGIEPLFLINGVAAGTSISQRIGRKCRFTSIYIRMRVVTGNTPQSQIARLIVVLDKQPNGAVMTGQQLLGSLTSGVANPWAPNNLDNRDRFKVLCDKTRLIQTNGGTSGATSDVAFFKIYKKINIQTTYSGTDALIGSISTNALYMMCVGSNASDAATNAVGTFVCRVRYTDD